MRANVQYNDFKGTAAADISDNSNNDIQQYLIANFKEFNSKRYFCKGCSIWISGNSAHNPINIRFICYDSIEEKNVCLCPLEDMTYDEVFNIFKRFEVVLGQNGIESIDVKNENWIDLK